MRIADRIRALTSLWYQVPWCVPAWGWREARVAARCMIHLAIARGNEICQFTEAVRKATGRQWAIPVGRGRDAILVALRALNLQRGDHVVLPAYICASVVDAVRAAGATPIFADIDHLLHVTPETVARALTPSTRCVIVSHLFGNTARIEEIAALVRSKGIALIDDAAQGFGTYREQSPIGSFGEFGVVCGGPGKPLASARGAVLVGNDRYLYDRACAVPLVDDSTIAIVQRTVSFWFWRRLRRYTLPLREILLRVRNDKATPESDPHSLSNLEAAILNVQLSKLAANATTRRTNAMVMVECLAPLNCEIICSDAESSLWLKLVVLLPESGPPAKIVLDRLAMAGVECQRGYQPWMPSDQGQSSIPVTCSLWERVICVPVDSGLRHRDRLVDQINRLLTVDC
jgi:dTDP-4-amino-4,6-dideoxygalactose transaminase